MTSAIRFGTRWACQHCPAVYESEWDIWRHLVEQHPVSGSGQRLCALLIAAVERGDFERPPDGQ